jgi:hypothetical protein
VDVNVLVDDKSLSCHRVFFSNRDRCTISFCHLRVTTQLWRELIRLLCEVVSLDVQSLAVPEQYPIQGNERSRQLRGIPVTNQYTDYFKFIGNTVNSESNSSWAMVLAVTGFRIYERDSKLEHLRQLRGMHGQDYNTIEYWRNTYQTRFGFLLWFRILWSDSQGREKLSMTSELVGDLLQSLILQRCGGTRPPTSHAPLVHWNSKLCAFRSSMSRTPVWDAIVVSIIVCVLLSLKHARRPLRCWQTRYFWKWCKTAFHAR